MKLSVIGTGYLGAVHAACMAEIGHEVLGVDVDIAKIAALAAGRTPFFEPGLAELLARHVATGRLRFGSSLAEAADFADVHFVCVGTPQIPGSQAADLRYVHAAVDGLAPHLTRPCLVVGKSTVPVGTAGRLAERLAERAPVGRGAGLAWNPEFLSEGHAVQETLVPDRIVAGTTSAGADLLLRQLYAPITEAGSAYIATDLPTAELVKVSANAFLATKVSFINAMAEVCEATGADVRTLTTAIGYDVRIGSRYLTSGVGFGGGCLPKDIRAFRARAEELGIGEALSFLGEIDQINLRRRRRAVDWARDLVGGSFAGANVGILGASFKPDSDDVRDSPALAIAAAIHREGAQVRVHDPEAIPNAEAAQPALTYVDDPAKACEASDVVLHLTAWAEYRTLDMGELADLTRTPRILDGRSVLDLEAWRHAGWTAQSLGIPRR